MLWLYLIALAVIGVVVVLLVGKWEGAAAPPEESPAAVPDPVDELLARRRPGGLQAEDLVAVQLDPAVRGYRMDQVDKLLDALAQQLGEAHHQPLEEPASPQERGERTSGGG